MPTTRRTRTATATAQKTAAKPGQAEPAEVAASLMRGIDGFKQDAKEPNSYKLHVGGKIAAQLLIRKSHVRVNVAKPLPTSAPTALRKLVEVTEKRWAGGGAVVTVKTAARVRELCEFLAGQKTL